jgi:hypothetical protein
MRRAEIALQAAVEASIADKHGRLWIGWEFVGAGLQRSAGSRPAKERPHAGGVIAQLITDFEREDCYFSLGEIGDALIAAGLAILLCRDLDWARAQIEAIEVSKADPRSWIERFAHVIREEHGAQEHRKSRAWSS